MLVVFPSMAVNVWNFSYLRKPVIYFTSFNKVLNFCYIFYLCYLLLLSNTLIHAPALHITLSTLAPILSSTETLCQ